MVLHPRARWTAAIAYRDLRVGSRHFLPILLGIALGVGAVVAVGTAAETTRRAVAREARSLMASDVEVRSTRAPSARVTAVLDAVQTRGGVVTRVTELIAMAAAARATTLVELKAVETGYPFYGRVDTDPARPLSDLLSGGPPYPAVVQDALLIRAGLGLGDRFRLGHAEFVVAAVLHAEPDRVAGAFSLGPRVLIARDALEPTGLIQPGSRIRYRTLLRLPDNLGAEAVRDELRAALADEPVEVTAYPDAQPQLRRTLDRLTTYLGLIGLTALLVGGIGVAGSIRAFLAEKWETLAVLKCVGARSGTLLRIYLAEIVALGLAGGLAGAFIGAATHVILTRLLSPFVAISLNSAFEPWPAVRGLLMGVLAALLFTLWPLLQILQQSPTAILHRDVAPRRVSRRASIVAAVIIGAGLSGLAWWQAGSWSIAGLFVGAVLAAGAVLGVAAWGLMRLAHVAPRPGGLAWRRGLANLHRPGARTAAVLVSIGVGVMVVLAVVLVEQAVRAELADQLPHDTPSLFFIDIQPDQRGAFAALMVSRSVSIDLTPVVRSRLVAINEIPIGSEGPPGTKPQDRWYFTREYVLTFRDQLPRDNAVVAGTWWDAAPASNGASSPVGASEATVSVEEDAARHLGVGVGSTMVFDIQGVRVTARVANLRSVDWNNRSTNFYVIFAPGALESAPLTYVGAASVPADVETSLQQAVISEFPNVTAIQIRDILESVRRVLGRISLAVRAVAAFTVVAGFVVLAGSLTATREARLREAMIFKAVGATRRAVARAFAIEFAVLGAAGGIVGVALATALAWGVLHFFLEMPWSWAPFPMVVAFTLTTLGTMAVGVASTYRLLGRRPFPVLRGE